MQASATLRRPCAILLALSLLWPAATLPLHSQRGSSRPRPRAHAAPKRHAHPAEKVFAPITPLSPEEEELSQLARTLREEGSAGAYARLAEFADSHGASELGARAALALGYSDFSKGRQPQAARWLERASSGMENNPGGSLLREYVLYWQAQVKHAQHRDADAVSQLEAFRREFPDSVQTEQAVESLAGAEMARGKAEPAVAALDAYPGTSSKPALLLLRAQARQKIAKDRKAASAAAALDYLAVYYRFPLSDEAKIAGMRLPALEKSLRAEFPGISIEERLSRAAAFYDTHKWREALAEYQRLLPRAMGADRERAQLRIAQCKVQRKAGPNVLAALQLKTPDLDAERLYSLSQAYRSKKQEAQMLAAIDRVVEGYARSRWADESLFAAGNYFWVNLDRARAASYYRRVLEQIPGGRYAAAAHWRIAWVAYLQGRPEAASLWEQHIRQYPTSVHTANALYWLGRAAERAGNAPQARSFYLKAQERFPQTYFGRRAAERLRPEPEGIGTAPVNSADFLALIPPPLPLPRLEDVIPVAAAPRWARAQALHTIAFDASAELELRAAFAISGSTRLLWEAAQSAIDAGHYAAGMATTRLAFPQLEARRLDEVPRGVWRTLFPLPFEANLRRYSERHQLDPMLVAALIRQESTFQPDAVSHAGAVGLMQILPMVARKLARRLRLPYSRARLFNPEYNLQLGTLYFSELLRTEGTPEAALAAYNAGEDRVAAWKGERNHPEEAEFVESIPFTETREYVQIVLRNADLYRQLYAKENPNAGRRP